MSALALHRPGLLTLLLSVLLLLWMRAVPVLAAAASPAQSFKLQDHLATKAPYTHRLRVQGAPYLHELPDPPGYEPIFLWLLSRHGSRWPTRKRMRQINSLEQLFRDLSPSVDPTHRQWMQSWTSPTAHMGYLAGELHATGDAEMMGLAERLRSRFPDLLADAYAPRRFPIISTQVPRAAQSASAFSLGFFGRWVHQNRQPAKPSGGPAPTNQPQQQQQQQGDRSQHTAASDINTSSSSSNGGQHLLGHSSWLPQPVAVSMLPRQADPLLRFFETCRAYREHEDIARRWLAPWMHQQIRQHIVPGLSARLGLPPDMPLHPCHVEAMWQLCAFEATAAAAAAAGAGCEDGGGDARSSRSSGSSGGGGSGVNGSRVCQLFSAGDAQLMEWLDDVRLYETQGYGATVNYAIAAPLLADLATALTTAAAAHAHGKVPLQRTRLHFAHCETLTPLATLMGLFAPQQQQQQQQPEVQANFQQRQRQRQRQRQQPAAAAAIDPQWHVALSDVEEEVLADLPVLEAAEAAAAAAGGSNDGQAGSSGSMLAVGGLSVSDEVLADLPVLQAAESAAAGGGLSGAAGAAGALGLPDPGAAQLAAVAAIAAESTAGAADKLPVSSSSDAQSPGGGTAATRGTKRRHVDQQQQQQQQEVQGEAGHWELKRRRQLAAWEPHGEQHDSSSSSTGPAESSSSSSTGPAGSSSSSSGGGGGSTAEKGGVTSGSSHSNGHHHGPAAEGCGSFKGSLIPSQDWLQPPAGWAPPFAVGDRDRAWRSGRVAPLGANMVLLLYGRTAAAATAAAASSDSRERSSDQRLVVNTDAADASGSSSGSGGSDAVGDFGDVLVRLVYNEQVVRVPGCRSVAPDGYDCTLQDFLDYVVGEKTAADRFKRYCYGSGVGASRQGSRDSRRGVPAAVLTADGLRLVLAGVQQQRLWEEEQLL